MNGAGWALYLGSGSVPCATYFFIRSSDVTYAGSLYPLDIWCADGWIAFGPINHGEKYEFI